MELIWALPERGRNPLDTRGRRATSPRSRAGFAATTGSASRHPVQKGPGQRPARGDVASIAGQGLETPKIPEIAHP